jgi:FtsZ-interacting cell division protein ZipA
MNSQEKKIVVGGVVIAALSSAGFSMAQGDFNHIDDDYKSPTIISEKTLASNESTSINTLKTDVAIVDENNEEEEIEIKDESNEKVKSKVNTLKQTSRPQTNTSTLQNKPQQKPTEPEVVPEVPEQKPTEPEVVPEVPEEKPTEPEVVPEVPEQKPTEPEVVPEVPEEKPTEPEVPEQKPTEQEVSLEVPVTGLVEDSIEKIETPSVEKQFDIN